MGAEDPSRQETCPPVPSREGARQLGRAARQGGPGRRPQCKRKAGMECRNQRLNDFKIPSTKSLSKQSRGWAAPQGRLGPAHGPAAKEKTPQPTGSGGAGPAAGRPELGKPPPAARNAGVPSLPGEADPELGFCSSSPAAFATAVKTFQSHSDSAPGACRDQGQEAGGTGALASRNCFGHFHIPYTHVSMLFSISKMFWNCHVNPVYNSKVSSKNICRKNTRFPLLTQHE